MFLLSLVQSAFYFVLRFDPQLGIQEIGGAAYEATGALLLVASMGIVIACWDRTTRAGLGRTFLYRTLPLLIDTAACLGIFFIFFFGFMWLLAYFIQPKGYIGFSALFMPSLWVLIVPAPMIFVTLPASVMEANWPLQSVWRSFQLTKGQRWRILGIILILLAMFSGGLFVADEIWFLLSGYASCETRGSVLMVRSFLHFLLIWPFTLAFTLIIVSAYRELISLKDGPDLSRAVAKFG